MEQKIYALQEELTNLHRRKGEHAQQIVELTSKLQEAEKVLTSKESAYVAMLTTHYWFCNYIYLRLTEAETIIVSLNEEKKALETSLAEMEAANQILRDEHQALHIAYTSMDAKFNELHVRSYPFTYILWTKFLLLDSLRT